jgi:hypothetical protein
VQNAPRVLQVFCPVSNQPPRSSSRVARLVRLARSLPAPGSDQAWHQRSSAAAIRGSSVSCCSGVPNAKSAGDSRKMPFCVTRCGAPAR